MRYLERAVRDLVVRSVNASGVLVLRELPLALQNNRSDFLALRRRWISGKPKGNDLDMVLPAREPPAPIVPAPIRHHQGPVRSGTWSPTHSL
jgi:hypothetical protein